VLTGEGADEFLGGYDIYKEAKIRRFWAKQPDSKLRPLLLKRIHAYLGDTTGSAGSYLASFFREGITDLENPEYSHSPRWKTTSRAKRFFSPDLTQATQHGKIADTLDIYYPSQFYKWDPLAQAQFLEITIFLSQYLLSSQGDRMGMANSVEGRFPFLDYRVVEFSNQLPSEYKLHGLNEKYILRKLAQEWLPEEIWQRTKKPYRAPIHRSFFNEDTQDYVHDLLSPLKLNETGFFNANAVGSLVDKIKRGMRLSETDDMALAGILSTQLLYHQFISHFQVPSQLTSADDIKVCNKKTGVKLAKNDN
jgi:asparagine synthase (glutamine-hydrolysing)